MCPSSHLLHVCVLLCLVHLVPCTLHQRVDLCRTQHHREWSTQSKSEACEQGVFGRGVAAPGNWGIASSCLLSGDNKFVLDGHSTHACKPIAGMHPSHAELFKVGAQVQPYKDCLNIDVCVSCGLPACTYQQLLCQGCLPSLWRTESCGTSAGTKQGEGSLAHAVRCGSIAHSGTLAPCCWVAAPALCLHQCHQYMWDH